MTAGVILFLLVLGFAFYFLPTWIALGKRKKNALAIFALNFLAGWTFVGWLVAFIWSLTKD